MNDATEKSELELWQEDVQRRLLFIIKDWEDRFSDVDDTLYTLGVRRALDVVLGLEPEL